MHYRFRFPKKLTTKKYCSYLFRWYPIKGYNETKKKFIRVYTKNNLDRKSLINSVKEKYATYSDDLTSYYQKIARETIKMEYH